MFVTLPYGDDATFVCPEGEVLLNAGHASGIDLPFGCRTGSCGQCCARITSGVVEQNAQVVLTDEQIAQGYRLLCRSSPRSDVSLLSHQEAELE